MRAFAAAEVHALRVTDKLETAGLPVGVEGPVMPCFYF
jgi:hypothetical protein